MSVFLILLGACVLLFVLLLRKGIRELFYEYKKTYLRLAMVVLVLMIQVLAVVNRIYQKYVYLNGFVAPIVPWLGVVICIIFGSILFPDNANTLDSKGEWTGTLWLKDIYTIDGAFTGNPEIYAIAVLRNLSQPSYL